MWYIGSILRGPTKKRVSPGSSIGSWGLDPAAAARNTRGRSSRPFPAHKNDGGKHVFCREFLERWLPKGFNVRKDVLFFESHPLRNHGLVDNFRIIGIISGVFLSRVYHIVFTIAVLYWHVLTIIWFWYPQSNYSSCLVSELATKTTTMLWTCFRKTKLWM